MVIYETINLINNKRYIGQDSNDNPNYLGSGFLLKKAIEKYGRENFIKVILERCETKEQLDQREKYWIEITNAQTSDNYYNIIQGGTGGNAWAGRENSDAHKQFKRKMRIINNDPKYIRTKNGHTEQTKENQRKAAVDRYTLKWFQNKYGTEIGTQKFEERNKRLSTRYLSEEQIKILQSISKDSLVNMIQSGYSFESICNQCQLSFKRMNKIFKETFNGLTYREVKNQYIS